MGAVPWLRNGIGGGLGALLVSQEPHFAHYLIAFSDGALQHYPLANETTP